MIPFKPPAFKVEAFNCPHCSSFSHQAWFEGCRRAGGSHNNVPSITFAFCQHCNKFSAWLGNTMIYPDASGILPPNPDLNQDIQDDYMEARAIVNKSPRGASALLRLCIQKLCQQLGEPGKNINDDISALVKKELPATMQKALDIVRVIGNNAVHPGQIDLKDDKETANKLFELVNLIAQVMITQPKEIDRLYGTLPETARNAIEDRDKT